MPQQVYIEYMIIVKCILKKLLLMNYINLWLDIFVYTSVQKNVSM